MKRRHFLGLAAGGLLGGGLGMLGYMHYLEPGWLQEHHEAVPLARPAVGGAAGAGGPVRLLHLSDFHLSEVVPLAFIEAAITQGLAWKPDLICYTGDFITRELPQEVAYQEQLARLAAAAPTWACLGNHDGGPWSGKRGGFETHDAILGLVRGAGITVLHNQCTTLTVRGVPLRLVGTGDLWSGECQPQMAFACAGEDPAGLAQQESALTILLSHNPDSKDKMTDYPWDLMLAGHTHGGQLRIPLTGDTPFAPVHDMRFVEGLHRWQDRWLYITRGVGNLHGMRFNCRPQISLLELG
jgi:uncharacterized protein